MRRPWALLCASALVVASGHRAVAQEAPAPSAIAGLAETKLSTPSEPADIFTSPKWGATVALGLVNPINLGLLRRMNQELTWAVETGYTPIPVGAARTLAVFNFEGGPSWHPTKTGLTLSSHMGFESISYSLPFPFNSFISQSDPTAPPLSQPPTTLMLNSVYVTATVGYTWVKRSGFTIGFDAGLQMPLIAWGGAGVDSTDPTTQAIAASLNGSIGSLFAHYGAYIIPRLTLVRIGWIF